MSRGAAGPALAVLHGFARALTSFVGRASQLDETGEVGGTPGSDEPAFLGDPPDEPVFLGDPVPDEPAVLETPPN